MSSPPSTRRTPSPTRRRRIHTVDKKSEALIGGGGFGRDLDSRNVATPRPNRILPERNRSDPLHTPTASDKEPNSVGDGRDRDTFSDTSSMSAEPRILWRRYRDEPKSIEVFPLRNEPLNSHHMLTMHNGISPYAPRACQRYRGVPLAIYSLFLPFVHKLELRPASIQALDLCSAFRI